MHKPNLATFSAATTTFLSATLYVDCSWESIFSISVLFLLFDVTEVEEVRGSMYFVVELLRVGQLQFVRHWRGVAYSHEVVVPRTCNNIQWQWESFIHSHTCCKKHKNLSFRFSHGENDALLMGKFFMREAPKTQKKSCIKQRTSARDFSGNGRGGEGVLEEWYSHLVSAP